MTSILSWSELPHELVARIKNCLVEFPSDLSRFCSVCSSWRSSIPPSKMSLPFPNVLFENNRHYLINQTTIYRIETLLIDTSQRCSVIAVKIVDGKLYFVDPLTNLRIDRTLHPQLPKELNLCDFRMTLLQTVYGTEFHYSDGYDKTPAISFMLTNGYDTKKSLFLSPNEHYDETMLALLNSSGKLCFYKLEKDQWIVREEKLGYLYRDIVLFQGRIWGIDNSGRTMIFTSSLEATEISPRMAPDGLRYDFYFLESRGDLFLVERLHYMDRLLDLLGERSTPTRVYKMVVAENKWVEAKHLDNRVFFIARDNRWSFWLPSLKENCIVIATSSEQLVDSFVSFLPDEFVDGLSDDFVNGLSRDSYYWNLNTGEHKILGHVPEFAKLFWPPLKWLMDGTTSV